MKERPRQPLFLARQSYRRRRLTDAARLLPFLGAFLFLLPVLWGPGPVSDGRRTTASDGIYVMLVWAGLIVGAFLMARALARETGGGDTAGRETAGSDTGTAEAAPPSRGGDAPG